jgi:hypothetical protein
MIAAAFNDQLVEYLARVPFEPFTIRLIDGRGWLIDAPDRLKLFACGTDHCFIDGEINRTFPPEMIKAIEPD